MHPFTQVLVAAAAIAVVIVASVYMDEHVKCFQLPFTTACLFSK